MKSIVLTPIRNEEWILDLFLRQTLKHFDRIILLDQASTDGSAEIARSFDRVDYLLNPETAYDERARQERLLAECRSRYGTSNIVFALDADELVSFAGSAQPTFDRLANLPPGTPIKMEKPAPLPGCERVIRYPQPALVATIDSGTAHNGSLIHSQRLPCDDTLPEVVLEDVMAIHTCFLRPQVFQSRWRWYAVLENIGRQTSFAHRLVRYRSDYISQQIRSFGSEPIDQRWVAQDRQLFDELGKIRDLDWTWYDLSVVELFREHGTRRFWLDDVWKFNWSEFVAANRGGILPNDTPTPVAPPWPIDVARQCFVYVVGHLIEAKQRLTQRKARA